jgi:hypothetical protein
MWQQREQLSSKFNQDISKSGYLGASSWPRPTYRESGIRAQARVARGECKNMERCSRKPRARRFLQHVHFQPKKMLCCLRTKLV